MISHHGLPWLKIATMRCGSIIPLTARDSGQPKAGTPVTPAAKDARIDSSMAPAYVRALQAARTAASSTP